jgi:hypothetical protein
MDGRRQAGLVKTMLQTDSWHPRLKPPNFDSPSPARAMLSDPRSPSAMISELSGQEKNWNFFQSCLGP